MGRLVLRRLAATVPVLLLVTFGVFLLLHLTPGDPIDVMMAESVDATVKENLRRELGLDRPLYGQYAAWMGRLVQGDLGRSIRNGEPVIENVRRRLRPSLELAFFAMTISVVIAFPVGILSAIRRNTSVDRAGATFALFGICMPNFLLALLLIFFFGVTLRWLPISGYTDPLEEPWNGLRSLTLPAITLGLALAAVVTRTLRSSLLEALAEDYVRTARAKGLSEWRVVWGHVLRNALIPVVTVLGLQLGTLIGGAVITEYVFALPGVGRLVVDAIFARDYPLVQGVVLLIAVGFILSNLAVDLLYGWIDPRIRYRCAYRGPRAVGPASHRAGTPLGDPAPGRAHAAGAAGGAGAAPRGDRRAARADDLALRSAQAGPRPHPGPPRPRAPHGHRQRGPRRPLADDLGHPCVAPRRLRLRRPRHGRGRDPGPPRRIHGRPHRRLPDAAHGRGAVLPAARARPRPGRGAGSGAGRRRHRSRRGVHAHLRAPHARPGADHHHARVRGGGAGAGRPGLARGLAPRVAECRHPHRDPGFVERGLCHPRRGLAILPRSGRAATRRVVGEHDQCGTRLSAAGALDRLLAGHSAVRDGGGIELRRRRGARCPRPAPQKVSEAWSTATRCAAAASASAARA